LQNKFTCVGDWFVNVDSGFEYFLPLSISMVFLVGPARPRLSIQAERRSRTQEHLQSHERLYCRINSRVLVIGL
jgi:hypothetical protein